jgi:hypothetical protein
VNGFTPSGLNRHPGSREDSELPAFAGLTRGPRQLGSSYGHEEARHYDRAFLVGPGFFAGVANGMVLGFLMYRSGLVPRGLAMFGLVGGPLVAASGIAVMFNVIERQSTVQAVATIPEFIWELSFAIYLIVKGFRPSPVLAGPVARGARS